MLRNITAWVLSDGKAGDELQCLGITDALGLEPQIRRVNPRVPWRWLMPRGPVDPAEAPGAPELPIAPPYPDLLIASGRRAVSYLRRVKKASQGRTYTVYLKDPRTSSSVADLVWVPVHDRLRATNVVVTLTSPHRVSEERLAAARAEPDPRLAGLLQPRVAVLVGGNSRHHRYTPNDGRRLVADLAAVARRGAGLMITASRRTPPELKTALQTLVERYDGFLWDERGENPYISLLALADYVVATTDSFNMVGEAAATGVPILLFSPSGGHPKLDESLAALADQGVVHAFRGRLEGNRYEPLNSTSTIAEAILAGLSRHRQSMGLPAPARDGEPPKWSSSTRSS